MTKYDLDLRTEEKNLYFGNLVIKCEYDENFIDHLETLLHKIPFTHLTKEKSILNASSNTVKMVYAYKSTSGLNNVEIRNIASHYPNIEIKLVIFSTPEFLKKRKL